MIDADEHAELIPGDRVNGLLLSASDGRVTLRCVRCGGSVRSAGRLLAQVLSAADGFRHEIGCNAGAAPA